MLGRTYKVLSEVDERSMVNIGERLIRAEFEKRGLTAAAAEPRLQNSGHPTCFQVNCWSGAATIRLRQNAPASVSLIAKGSTRMQDIIAENGTS